MNWLHLTSPRAVRATWLIGVMFGLFSVAGIVFDGPTPFSTLGLVFAGTVCLSAWAAGHPQHLDSR